MNHNDGDYELEDLDFEIFTGNKITKFLKYVGLYALCIIVAPIAFVIIKIRKLLGKDREYID